MWGFDAGTKKPCVSRVLRTFAFDKRELLVLGFDTETICCTPLHRFFTGVWTPASGLRAGDQVMRWDGNWGTLHTVDKGERSQRVFNLNVERLLTFYVGASGFLVHNMKNPKPDEGDGDGWPDDVC